jgi:hypothetical protein
MNAFLSVTATVGALGLLKGGKGRPPVELLDGSMFDGYVVPALILLVVVGGSALWATILTVERDENAPIACGFAGATLVVFEKVEILVIGSPAGPATVLQAFYITLGLAIIVTALVQLARTRAALP